MNKQQLQLVFKNLAEQKAPAAKIDLWPAVQSSIQMSQPSQETGVLMNQQDTKLRRRMAPVFVLLAVILIGAVFFALPQGRALAQQMLHFFNRGESNVMPGPTSAPEKWVEQTPGVAAPTLTPQPTTPSLTFEETCGTLIAPRCSIETIRDSVAFPVYALAELPEGMVFSGATGNPDQVYLVYSLPDTSGTLIIVEQPFSSSEALPAWEVGADAEVQTMKIGAVPAEYVKGAYDGSSEPPVWNSDINLHSLRWLNEGILFDLQWMENEPRTRPADMAALAATLTDGPVGDYGTPVIKDQPEPEAVDFHEIYPLSLAEAEEQAGFKLLTPASLPQSLAFVGAKYDEERKVVELFYYYSQPNVPEATDGLLISQQAAPRGMDCDLCSFVRGTGLEVEQYPAGKLVSQDAIIETVQVGELPGQYLEGIGWVSRDETSGWQWESTPYVKRLRFQTDEVGLAFAFYGFGLEKSDILAIAENMK